MNYLFTFIAVLIPLTILDAFWILIVAKNFYTEQIGFLFAQSIHLIPLTFFYPIYAIGILFFVVLPAVSFTSWTEAFWRGALLGLIAYGTYNLTNHATIANWPTSITLIDIAWGVVVTALTSVIAYFLIINFNELYKL